MNGWFVMTAAVGLAVVAWQRNPSWHKRPLPNLVPTPDNINAALAETGGPLGVTIAEALTSTHPTPAGAGIGIAYMTASQQWPWNNQHLVGLPLPPVSCSPINFGGHVMCERYYSGKGGNVQY